MASLDTLSYTSINSVNSEDDETSHMDKLYTSMKLSSNSPIEIPYYGTFPNESLCFYCGAEDGFVDGDNNEYPLCESCKKIRGKSHIRSKRGNISQKNKP